MLEPGSHVLVAEDGYGGSGRLFRQLYARYNISFEFLDFRDTDDVIQNINSKTKLVWLESPSNPLLRIADIEAISAKAHSVGAITTVDNTFASPIFQQPLLLGADIVMHSTTKYIGGHSDLLGGALMTNNSELAEKLKFIQFATGGIPSPFECFLLLRSIKTLAIRMKKHQENALAIAQAMQTLPFFKEVLYPGLESHPQHELACRQMSGFGGMISFETGSLENAKRVLEGVRVCTLGESLGGVESLISHPATMTHASVPAGERIRLGITDGLVRVSVGIEDVEDIIEDLDRAINELG